MSKASGEFKAEVEDESKSTTRRNGQSSYGHKQTYIVLQAGALTVASAAAVDRELHLRDSLVELEGAATAVSATSLLQVTAVARYTGGVESHQESCRRAQGLYKVSRSVSWG